MRNVQYAEAAFFRISSMILAHRNFETILDLIVRESLSCLNAHRASSYQLDEKNGTLHTKFTHASGPEYAQIGLFEEKELARSALKQRNPPILKGPKDLSGLFKFMRGERKITSLMIVPFPFQGKSISGLSSVLIDELHTFDEKDLQLFSIFANYACMAMENAFLLAEVRKRTSLLQTYEQNLANIQNHLQDLAKKEIRYLEENIQNFLTKKEEERKTSDPSNYSNALAKTYNISMISLKGFTLDPLLQKLVDEKYAANNMIVVLENSADKIKLALAEPTQYIMEELKRITPARKIIEFCLADPNEVQLCFKKYYDPFAVNKLK